MNHLRNVSGLRDLVSDAGKSFIYGATSLSCVGLAFYAIGHNFPETELVGKGILWTGSGELLKAGTIGYSVYHKRIKKN
ncbi:MAG: hypothetical protein WC533_00705 [Candidatus Pacearchaeota archaeon]